MLKVFSNRTLYCILIRWADHDHSPDHYFLCTSHAHCHGSMPYTPGSLPVQIARVIRGTPLLVQLFIIFYGPAQRRHPSDAFSAAVIAFAINEGAYCAETMRAALESVPQGRLEAGYCVGIVLVADHASHRAAPALRTAVPSLSNSLIGMVKDSSRWSPRRSDGRTAGSRPDLYLPAH